MGQNRLGKTRLANFEWAKGLFGKDRLGQTRLDKRSFGQKILWTNGRLGPNNPLAKTVFAFRSDPVAKTRPESWSVSDLPLSFKL